MVLILFVVQHLKDLEAQYETMDLSDEAMLARAQVLLNVFCDCGCCDQDRILFLSFDLVLYRPFNKH